MKKMYLFLFLVFIVKLNFATLVVTITNPINFVDTICQGTNINLSCSVTGATSSVSYVWKINYTQVSTNATYNFVATNAGYNVCIVTATSGTETSLDTVVVVVVSGPVPPTVSNVSYCQGAAAAQLTAIGTNLLWYTMPTGGTGSTIAPTPSTAVVGETSWYVSQTVNGIESPRAMLAVTINPAPAIVIPVTDIVCSGVAFTITPCNGVFGTIPFGTTYSWPIPNVTGGMTPSGVAGAGDSIYGTLINQTNTSQVATYIVIPTSGAGCVGDTFNVIVTVLPLPTIVSPLTDTVCSGTPFTITPVDGVNGIVPPGTTYSWSIPSVSVGMPSGAAGAGDSIYGTLLNVTNTPQIATYTVTPTSGAGCVGSVFTVIVTVNPVPIIVSTMTDSVCSGTPFTITPVNGVNGVVPAGTTYSWSNAIYAGGLIGGAAGNGDSIYGTIANPTSTPQTATYTVTPTIIGGNYMCTGTTFTVTIVVNPVTSIPAPYQDIVCSGEPFSVMPLNGLIGVIASGTTYSWGAPFVTGGVTGGTAGSGDSIYGTLVNPTNIPQPATYIVIPTSGAGCIGDTFNVDVTVLPAVSANFTLVADTTTPHLYYAVNNASGVAPLQYVWSWGDGTANDTAAYPSHTYSVAGYYKICLTITDSTGCTNTYCDSTYLQKSTNSMITVNVIHQGTLGINENESNNQIKVYPNPAKDILTIETNSNKEQKIEITSLIGQTVYTTIINNKKAIVNTSAFANGVYILKLSSDNETVVRKFVKE